MTKDDEVINHLHCAWHKKEQGYTDEAMEEILKALGVLLERDIPRAGERIKSPCLVGKSCKKCLIEDGGCEEFILKSEIDELEVSNEDFEKGIPHSNLSRSFVDGFDCCKEKLKRRGQ